MKSLFMGVLIAAGLIFALMNYHIVIYDDGATMVRKEKLTLDDAYLDTRDLGPLAFAGLPKPVRSFLLSRGWEKTKKEMGQSFDNLKKKLVGE